MWSPGSLVLFALVQAAAVAPSALEQVAALLGQNRCDEAFELIAKVEVPDPPASSNLQVSRSLAKGAEACRTSDPVVAVAFSSLAMRLAPRDAEVVVTHAEGLVAVHEESDAAAVLDALIAAQPAQDAPTARMMRAKMAHQFGDYEEAVRLLTPLAAEPLTQRDAGLLLAAARAGLQQRKEHLLSPRAPDATRKAAVAPARAVRRLEPGRVVATLPGSISLHGQTVLHAKLEKGQPYVFRAKGRCDRSFKERRTSCGGSFWVKPLDARGTVFGLDFRVQFGAGESRSLSMGVGQDEESQVDFVADSDVVDIRVFDESNPDKEVTCTVGQFSIVAR